MAEPTHESTHEGETPSIATLADLVAWCERHETDLLILSGKGMGGLVLYKPAHEGDVSSQQVRE